MSDDKEFGITNVGTDGVQQIPVESKERTVLDKEVDTEIVAKGKDAINDFDETQTLTVPAKKKRGRPSKKAVEEVKPLKQWYCSTCKENINDLNVMKIGAGTNRWAVFCPQCQRSFGFQDQEMLDKVDALIKNNPTGK